MKVQQSISIAQRQQPVNLLDVVQRGKAQSGNIERGISFKDMFSRELANNRKLVFSKHAEQRLFSRGISLSDDMIHRIADAVDQANIKGSRQTLILTDDSALVVSVKNRTVITAFDKNNLREGVVTSIDSAVIL